MRQEKATVVISDQGRQDLTTLDRLDDFLVLKQMDYVVEVAAITRPVSA